jgi:hypothetical protein
MLPLCFARLEFKVLEFKVCKGQSLLAFSQEITVHSIFWDRFEEQNIYDRRQICERVEVSTIKYELFRRPKMKYLLFTLNF